MIRKLGEDGTDKRCMSSESKENEQTCPSCQAELHSMLVDGSTPDFCLKCRFPLMLVANKYRLIRKFDEGGFAIIYEAKHIHLTRDPKRVIKVIKPEFLENENLTSRFFREVQVTSALSQRNSHIVRIYDDFGEIPNLGYFYVMEFLEGKPLSDFLDDSDGILPLELCYRLFLQLCDAMQAAHSEQIIHRDLKPHNMFIIQQGRESHFLKVIDFGIAKPIGNSKEATQVTQGILGTPAYMAPEQCINKNVGAAADIYAMGCVLYEFLVGETPFVPRDPDEQDEISVMEIMSAHLNKPPPPLESKQIPGRQIPPALERVVRKSLAKKPADRYASVEEFEQAFLQALPDAHRPGSYLSSVQFSGESVAKEKFDDIPSFSMDAPARDDFRRNTPPPQPSHHREPLPDLFRMPNSGDLENSFSLEETPTGLNEQAIQPVLPGSAGPSRAVTGGRRYDSQPPSRGVVRRVIEIDRKREEPIGPQKPSETGSILGLDDSYDLPISKTSSFESGGPQIQLPGHHSSPPRINTGLGAPPRHNRRNRTQTVYSGRTGVGRSPLREPERRSLVLPLLMVVMLLGVVFVYVQTFHADLFPWGKIFPWGPEPKKPPKRRSQLQTPTQVDPARAWRRASLRSLRQARFVRFQRRKRS